jgi:Mg/Co/Ni transporter MgtE
MSHYTISLKNEIYYIPFSRKPNVQKEIKELDTKMENYRNLIKDLELEKKKKTFELLDDRQLIIYKNQYPKNMDSESLKKNKQYEKRMKLLKSYDDQHGTYLIPTI